MSLAFSDVNAGVGALSKPEQPHPAGSNAADVQEPSGNVTARISNQIGANASKPLLSNGIDYNIFHQRCQSIPSHYGQSQYQHPALDVCEMQVSRPTTSIIENKQDQVSDHGQNLAQTGQIVAHGFAQTQTQSSAPVAPVAKSHRKRCTQPEQNNHWDQNIPTSVQIHNLAVGQSQPIMQDRRSIPTSADAQPQASNHGRAPVNGSNQVQGGNGYPNSASPSRTPLSTSSVSLSTDTPSSLSSVPTVSNLNVSADTSRDVDSFSTGIVAASGTAARPREVGFDAESGSPHANQTDVDLNTINNSDANASMDDRNLNESSASSHCEKTWMPRGMDKVSGSGCPPQSPSPHIASQPLSGIQMSSPQLKKRKRESTLGPERGEPSFFSQGHPVSQPIPSSLRTVSPSLSSNSTANGVKTEEEEVRLVPGMDADMLSNSNLTPLSDTVIGSDIVIPNQLSGVETTRFLDHGTVSDSEANANAAFGSSGDVASATVYYEVAQPGFEPLPVTTQSTETILVHNYHQSATPTNPRRNPHLAQKVGNVLQNLVATTGIDSRLVLRFSKELHASKTELRRREANEAENAIVAEQSAVNSNHVNQSHIDSISSAFVEKLNQKDHEISCLVQELRNFREQYGAVVRTLEARQSQFHSVLSAKENENQILVERNRQLEVQLSAMQTDKTRITNHCRSLEITLSKYINNNYPSPLNFPTQPFINSPTTPGTPISPINQQPSFPHAPPHPIRRESISTVSTTSTQGSEQGIPPLTRMALTAPVPRAKAMPRAGSNEIQLHEQQGHGRVPPGPPPSCAELDHRFQQRELARQHHHPQTGSMPPSFPPPPLSQFSPAQHQQSQQVSAVAQYQKQLLDKQNGAQDQVIGRFGHVHRSQLPGPQSHIPPTSRKQLLARHAEQARPTVHEQTTRRYSEPVITHGTNIKRGFQRSRIVSNQYPGDPRPPQIYTQLPVSQVPTPVNAVSTQPLNFPTPGPSGVPLSYMAESFSQSSVQPVRQEIQKSVAPIPHTGDTEMQQPSSLQSQMQALPIKQGTQPTDVHSYLSKSSGDYRFDVIDLTFDEGQINTDTDGPPKKRLKADRDKDAGNQSAPSTPTDPPAPLMVIVDDVKVETDNEAMATDGEPVAERHADVLCASPSTLSNPSNELPVQSSIIHGIDISNPEVVDYLNEAFLAVSKEDPSLRYCFCCQFRTEGDPADCPEITRLRDPTIEEILNHLREEHSTVFEGICSGDFGGEQEQVQAE